jgi:hypothetical protein
VALRKAKDPGLVSGVLGRLPPHDTGRPGVPHIVSERLTACYDIFGGRLTACYSVFSDLKFTKSA